MPVYFGAKQLFRNRLGGGAIREIYLGSKQVMGFTTADYSTNEWVGEKAHAGDYPEISANGTSASIGTNELNPGYGFTKYYCDHLKFYFQYSGSAVVYDCNGNEVVNITSTISFDYLTANWTIGSTIVINGSIKRDTSYSSTSTPADKLTYEVYYNLSTRQWTVIFDGSTYTGNTMEWIPTFVRLGCQMWFISSISGISAFNGFVWVTYMNRARGYPSAR